MDQTDQYGVSRIITLMLLVCLIVITNAAALYAQETPAETPTFTPTATPTHAGTHTETPTSTPLPKEFISTEYGLFSWVIMNGIEEFSPYGNYGSQAMGTHPNTGELYLLTKQSYFNQYELTIIHPNTFQSRSMSVQLGYRYNDTTDNIDDVFSLSVLPNGDYLVGGYSGNRHEVIVEVKLLEPMQIKRVVYFSGRGRYFRDFYVLNPQEQLKGFADKEGIVVVRENQLVLVQESSIEPIADLPIPESPLSYYQYEISRSHIFRGPDQFLYIGYYVTLSGEPGVSYIFRIEEDYSLTQIFGKFNYYPRFYLTGITYNQFNHQFYFTNSNELFQANDDFSSITKIAEARSLISSFEELNYSEHGNVVWMRTNGQSSTIFTLTSNPETIPSPTPTRTPYPHTTFRPTPVVEQPISEFTMFEPSFSVNLLTNGSVESFSVIPGRDEFIFGKTGEQRVLWSGYEEFETALRLYGPAPATQNAIPYFQIAIFAQYQLGLNTSYYRNYQLKSLSSQKSLLIYPNQEGYLLLPQQLSYISNQATKFDFPVYDAVYIGEGHSFMDIPSGNALLYEYRQDGNVFHSFDPEQDEIELSETILPETDEAFSHFHWGPSGKLHALYEITRTREYDVYSFENDGSLDYAVHIPYRNLNDIEYLPVDDAYYFLTYNYPSYFLYRLPGQSGDPQPVLAFPKKANFYPTLDVSHDGSLLFCNTGDTVYSLQSNAEPGMAITTPTPTVQNEPFPTPTPMDWIIMDGFGGLHTSRAEVERPLLPYFAPADIARDLEPDPMGNGWYMLDGYGGIHPSSAELPMPESGIPYIYGFDFAVNLEIVLMNGNYNFLILDRFGAVHKVGPDIESIQTDTPWFGRAATARDLELAETKDAWMVMDVFGVLFDSRDYSITLATDAFWGRPLAKGFSVLPAGERIMIDAYGGLHANQASAFDRVRSFEHTPYIPGYDIFWDIELIQAPPQ